jgi:hypothetical protein
VADLVIDLERPVIVKEIGIEVFHSHPNFVFQLTTDGYGSCLLVVPSLTQTRSVSGMSGSHAMDVPGEQPTGDSR